MVFIWKMPCWLCQQCSWQHIIQRYLWWNIYSKLNKLHLRGSYPGPYSNAFRVITGEVRYFRLICLCWSEFGPYSLNAVGSEGSAEWGKKQESCPHLVLFQACNGAIRRWPPLGGQEGLSWAGTPSAPWLGAASLDPELRLHICCCIGPRAVVEPLLMNKHTCVS